MAIARGAFATWRLDVEVAVVPKRSFSTALRLNRHSAAEITAKGPKPRNTISLRCIQSVKWRVAPMGTINLAQGFKRKIFLAPVALFRGHFALEFRVSDFWLPPSFKPLSPAQTTPQQVTSATRELALNVGSK